MIRRVLIVMIRLPIPRCQRLMLCEGGRKVGSGCDSFAHTILVPNPLNKELHGKVPLAFQRRDE